jgi:predicted NBD/HSP70 family sugar kinase
MLEPSHPTAARLGVDLGGTKIEAIVMQGDGSISHRQRVATPKGNYQETLEAIWQLTDEICSAAGLDRATPIGMGTPGAISLKTGRMINCNSTCLNDQLLAQDLATLTGRAVRIANDADCFALSEANDDTRQDTKWLVGIILGTGVGGGLVIDQRLSHGVNAIRGEWGHNSLATQVLQHPIPTPILEHVHQCYCGRVDCIETWISGPALENHYRILSGERLSAEDIVSRMRGGEALAVELFQCHLHLTALAMSSLINILDPDVIVLGGGLSNVPELYRLLPDILPQYVFSDVFHTRIEQAIHGDSSGVRGAAWLWYPDKIPPQANSI